jgi:hypothetical protein
MSQLAALIEKGQDLKTPPTPTNTRPKVDPIAAILASAGVQYTHENSEVVGTSKVEAELSRRAQEAGNDDDYGEQRLFSESQSQRDDPGGMKYVFHPPEEVLVRQFCTMARTFGFASATEFALVVEGWTQKQRRDCLERFYARRRARLGDSGSGEGDHEGVEDVNTDEKRFGGRVETGEDAAKPSISTPTQAGRADGPSDDVEMDLKVPDTPPDVPPEPVMGSDTESDEDDEL